MADWRASRVKVSIFDANRCIECGLLVKRHFDASRRKLSCREALHRHPRATVRKVSLVELLAKSLETRR